MNELRNKLEYGKKRTPLGTEPYGGLFVVICALYPY